MGLFDWAQGAGTPPCPAGSKFCSGQSKTEVGKKPGAMGSSSGTGIYHATATTVTQGSGTEITGSESVVYIVKNGTWQPAAITKDGGKTYQFSDPKYPLMDGVAGADLVKDLGSSKRSDIQKNIDANIQKKIDKEPTISPEEKGNIIDSAKNTSTQPESGDSQSAPPTSTAGTRVFENMQYPSNISAGQDVIQFTALSYAVKQLSGFTFGGRDRVPVGTTGGRSKGTVTLPIQSGIKDQNAANWGDETMNPAQIALAGIAMKTITGGGAGMGKAIDEIKSQIQTDSADVTEALATKFAENASQVKGLLSRTTGKIQNPNLELLFQKPSLRPFSFQFRMSARNADEAKQIIAIIRFFKQNMAPQKGGGSGGESANLFLKAPNTFQVHYLHRGVDQGEEHKFIGRMKECAMTSFEVDYTPDGNYSTYEDGVMTSYTISMSMKELEPVFFEDYDDGDIPADAIGF
ncbi:hypothetical protein OAA64_02020 [bacterium]|nr:hypothetical protein [bacterium]